MNRPRNIYGAAAIRFIAIIAVAILFIGLLNQPSGDFSPSVDLTPHASHTSSR